MGVKKFLDGDTAVAYAVMGARAEVAAAYPITPQTIIVERISELIAGGGMDCEYIKVESEHSALSAAMGASITGVRAFTATSSQGLAYMNEMLHYVAGARLPVVMGVVNRALAPPWNIWCDHQDSIAARDTGWIQLYVETVQEAYDTTIQAFRIAEDPKVMTPVMVCLDAFVLSHTNEVLMVEEKESIAEFLPPLKLEYKLDTKRPLTLAAGAIPEYYTEYRFAQQKDMISALEVIEKADEEYAGLFGRSYGGLLDAYFLDDAQAVIICMGSMSGTVRDVVDAMRAEGEKTGLLRLRSFRPFPREELCRLLSGVKTVGAVDRNCSFGFEGALASEAKASLYALPRRPKVYNFIAGLGGRDITAVDIRRVFDTLLSEEDFFAPGAEFLGLRWAD